VAFVVRGERGVFKQESISFRSKGDMATGPSSETASAREALSPPVSWRGIVAVLALVALCDITLYRNSGAAGHAALVVLAPLLFWLGSPRPRYQASLWVVSLMLAVLAAKRIATSERKC